jgi:hypothetical protein
MDRPPHFLGELRCLCGLCLCGPLFEGAHGLCSRGLDPSRPSERLRGDHERCACRIDGGAFFLKILHCGMSSDVVAKAATMTPFWGTPWGTAAINAATISIE